MRNVPARDCVSLVGGRHSGTASLSRILRTSPRCIPLGGDRCRRLLSRLFDDDDNAVMLRDALDELATSRAREAGESGGRAALSPSLSQRAGHVLIEDVDLAHAWLPRLTQFLQPHLLAGVRNPYASVASCFYHLEADPFAAVAEPGDVRQVVELIDADDHERWRRFRGAVAEMPVAAFEALRWRVQTEPLLDFTRDYHRGYLVIYERLAADPLAQTRAVFAFLGWSVEQPTLKFLEAFRHQREDVAGGAEAFADVGHRWRHQLTDEQRDEIADVVRDSPALHLWPDLLPTDELATHGPPAVRPTPGGV